MNTITETRDHRSRLYERYVSLQVQRDQRELASMLEAPNPYLERVIARHFPAERHARILDAGCGFGHLLHVLSKQGYSQAAGVEASGEQVEVARSLGLKNVQQANLLDVLQRNPGTYDVIVAFDVLEHFTKDEVLEVLTAAYGALKPGGKFILHVPNGEAIFAGKIYFGDFTHQVAFTAKSLRQVAMYAGFTRVECFEDKPVVHGVFSAIRAALWWVVRTKFRFINMVETGDTGGALILSQNFLAVCRKP